MLQTSLLGRWFKNNMDGLKFRVAVVYSTGGYLFIVGENEKGSLVSFNSTQITLIEES